MSIQKSIHKINVVFGDWDKHTIRLDFDNTSINEVKYWCFKALAWFDLEGFIILESSQKTVRVRDKRDRIVFTHRKRSFLAVFNKSVSWSLNVKIMNWVGVESGIVSLQNYVHMQCIKQNSTLRFSSKGKKPVPTVVFSYGKQDRQISKFLETREFVLHSLEGFSVA